MEQIKIFVKSLKVKIQILEIENQQLQSIIDTNNNEII